MSNGRKIWYYRTYDEFGNRTNGKTTGKTSKTLAEKYCIELFKNDLLIPDSSMKLSDYIKAKSFFTYGECAYSAENGIGRAYAADCYSRMDSHILPLLGHLKFESINSKTIEAWQKKLLTKPKYKKKPGDKPKKRKKAKKPVGSLSVKTVRECKTVLRIILNSARSDGYIRNDLFDGVKKLPRHKRKVRGILTEKEVRDLFDERNFITYWKGNIHYYIASYVACFTGMRQGEILALTPEKIFPKHIYVNASWSKNELGPTKTGETRKVYIRPEIKEKIDSIMLDNGYLFSLSKGRKPLTGNRLTDALYYALECMGIDEDMRKKRNITFHSFRHWFVTYLRGKGISDAEITSITGQKTSQVIDDYTRFDLIENKNIVKALDGF